MPSGSSAGQTGGSGGYFKSSLNQQHGRGGDEGDGSLMSNLATTAKDLFGALWTYGGQQNNATTPTSENGDSKRDSNKDFSSDAA
jgi:hypothetical protein